MRYLLLLLVPVLAVPARAEVAYLGATRIPGTAVDQSGLEDILADGTPHNRLGGLGSAIAWTGSGHRYLAVPDRGPKDGAVPYACRYHVLEIDVTPGRTPPLTTRVIETHLLTDDANKQLVGAAAAFDTGLRFDPEGVRVGKTGTLFISDEYGPHLWEFNRSGKLLRRLEVPEHFRVSVAGATPEREEPPHNARGRVPNRGFEGLALSADGSRLLALLQSPLIQDGGRDGLYVRLLEITLDGGATRELIYPLDEPNYGTNEILAVNDYVYLVIERDGKAGSKARFKKVMRINLADATNVAMIGSLSPNSLPESVKAVVKEPLIDLLDPRFGLAGDSFPDKVEGLAFGPDLPDGRKLLLVMTDNDFQPDVPTWLYAFALDPADLTAPWPGPRALLPALPPPDETVSPFALPALLLAVVAGCLLVLIAAWRWVGGGRNRLVSQRK